MINHDHDADGDGDDDDLIALLKTLCVIHCQILDFMYQKKAAKLHQPGLDLHSTSCQSQANMGSTASSKHLF